MKVAIVNLILHTDWDMTGNVCCYTSEIQISNSRLAVATEQRWHIIHEQNAFSALRRVLAEMLNNNSLQKIQKKKYL